jgi:hypothetical protein
LDGEPEGFNEFGAGFFVSQKGEMIDDDVGDEVGAVPVGGSVSHELGSQ